MANDIKQLNENYKQVTEAGEGKYLVKMLHPTAVPEERDVFIVSESDYMGDSPSMYEFRGTFRELYGKIFGFQDDDDDPELPPNRHNSIGDLIAQAEDINGDGMPYYMVWSTKHHKQVFG